MTFLQAVILFIAAILGGALNAVAGGGSFITFPSLIFSGVLPIQANATSTVAIWPGAVASAAAYRKELASQQPVLLLVLAVPSFIGGILGAFLLLSTPQETFVQLIPFLLLMATLLFAFSAPLTNSLRSRTHKRTGPEQHTHSELNAATNVVAPLAGTLSGGQVNLPPRQDSRPHAFAPSWRALSVIAPLQLIIATYGGYFGGGIGILMLATLGLMGMENIHQMNAMKTLLASCINGVAVITFIVRGAVEWPQGIVMVIGAIIGGFAGAYYARQLDPRQVRVFVILVGTGLTIYFFVHNIHG